MLARADFCGIARSSDINTNAGLQALVALRSLPSFVAHTGHPWPMVERHTIKRYVFGRLPGLPTGIDA